MPKSKQEILANKLCTLLSRAEVRDLVDVMALEEAGFSVQEALKRAERKDAGLTAAQLAWILSQISIDKAASLPGDTDPAELLRFLDELIERLTRLAHPGAAERD